MAYEVDYIPVGEGERGGDAIAMRLGNLNGPREEQMVVIIDGGFKESGGQLAQHVKSFYNTKKIDLAILTHPDSDHASGLCSVLEDEELEIGALVMHRPWEHAAIIKSYFKDGRITSSGLEEKLEKSLQHASDLESLAAKRKITVIEPFEGVANENGSIRVLGPSMAFYQQMLAQFGAMPATKPGLISLLPTTVQKATTEAIEWIEDNVGVDLLNEDDDTTSAQNNTSTIILFNIDGKKLLFTGDAGKSALLNAIAYAESLSIPLNDLTFLDVPHHGSKRNLNSKILKKIKAETSFISGPKDSTKHPAKKITNALKKQGTKLYVTRGSSLLHHNQGNARGWGAATEEPFHPYVEA
jgi:beta-lactamase superfamily II metal-dependent hydrolase